MIVDLLLEPLCELVHQRLALCLVVRQACRWAHLLIPRLVIMVKDLLDDIKHHPAFRWKDLCDVAELTTPMRQAVTANDQPFLYLIAR